MVLSFRNFKTAVVYKKFKMACPNTAIVQLSNIIFSNCPNVTFVQGFMAEHMTVCGGHLTAGETASQIFSHAKVSGAIHRGGWDNQNQKYFFRILGHFKIIISSRNISMDIFTMFWISGDPKNLN